MFGKKDKKKEVKKEIKGFYKGYEMRWLREQLDHPDYKLVAEYDKLNKEE